MTGPTTCAAFNTRGEPCGITFGLDDAGYCQIHGEGGAERQRAISAKGGEATAKAWAAVGFKPEELPDLVTVEDAMTALDVIRRAAMTRRLTHAESNAASKAVSEWVKAHAALQTQKLVGELQKELDAKTAEIEELRKQLNTQSRMRAVR